MRFGKNMILLITTASFVFLSSGCNAGFSPFNRNNSSLVSNEEGSSSRMVEVDLGLASYDPEVPGWNAVVDAANKKLAASNIVIKINKIPTSTWEPYYQKILTLMAAGCAPDIGRIAESYLPIMIQKHQVLEITDRISEIDTSLYVDKVFEGAAFENERVYGVPCGVYTTLLYYNKDLFDKAGLTYPSGDWNKPMTWIEFSDTAKRLTNGEGAGKVFGAYINLGLLTINQYLVGNYGKKLYDSNGVCTLGYPKNAEIFDLFGKMFREDCSMMSPVDAKIIKPGDLFRAGRLAMMIEGTWYHHSAKSISRFKPGIAAIPSNTGKSVATSFIDAWVIYHGAKHEIEAWEALKAIISEDAFDALAPYGVGGIPATKATISAYKDRMIGSIFDDVDKKAFVDSLEHTIGASYSVNINDFSQEWNFLLEQFSSGMLSTNEFIERETEVITTGNIKKN